MIGKADNDDGDFGAMMYLTAQDTGSVVILQSNSNISDFDTSGLLLFRPDRPSSRSLIISDYLDITYL